MLIIFLQDYPPLNMKIFRSLSFLLCLCLLAMTMAMAMAMAMADERSTNDNDESSRALQDQAVALDSEALNWQLKGKLPKFGKGFNSDRRLSSKACSSKSSKCSAVNDGKHASPCE